MEDFSFNIVEVVVVIVGIIGALYAFQNFFFNRLDVMKKELLDIMKKDLDRVIKEQKFMADSIKLLTGEIKKNGKNSK